MEIVHINTAWHNVMSIGTVAREFLHAPQMDRACSTTLA